MASYNILIGFKGDTPHAYREQLRTILTEKLADRVHSVFLVDNVDELLHTLSTNREINCVLLNTIIGTEQVGINLWTRIRESYPHIRIIPVINDAKKGTKLCKTLHQLEIFDGVYLSDFKTTILTALIQAPRSSMDAHAYYGLEQLGSWRAAPLKEPVSESHSSSGPVVVEPLSVSPSDGTHSEEIVAKEKAMSVPKPVTEVVTDNSSSKKPPLMKPVVDAFEDTTVSEKGADEVSEYLRSILNSEESALEYLAGKSYLADVEYSPEVRPYPSDVEIDRHVSAIVNSFTQANVSTMQLYESGKLSKEQFLQKVREFFVSHYRATNNNSVPSGELVNKVLSAYSDYQWRYGKIAPLIDDPDVTDIRLMDYNMVLVQVEGVWHRTDVVFSSPVIYTDFIKRICTQNKVALNNQNAQPIFGDITTHELYRLRFQISSDFINSSRLPSGHIRKIDKIKKLVPQLMEKRMFTAQQAAYLIHQIRKGTSFIICGGSGSGKTVLTNCLIEYLDSNICGTGIQEVEELFSDTKRNIEWQHSVYIKGEGKNNYALQDLSTSALLKNTMLFIIGEIKNREARDFFTAWNTGSQCIGTTHADGIEDAFPRIADLAKRAGDYSQADILEMLSRGGGCIVFMKKYKIVHIANVLGWDKENQRVRYEYIRF